MNRTKNQPIKNKETDETRLHSHYFRLSAILIVSAMLLPILWIFAEGRTVEESKGILILFLLVFLAVLIALAGFGKEAKVHLEPISRFAEKLLVFVILTFFSTFAFLIFGDSLLSSFSDSEIQLGSIMISLTLFFYLLLFHWFMPIFTFLQKIKHCVCSFLFGLLIVFLVVSAKNEFFKAVFFPQWSHIEFLGQSFENSVISLTVLSLSFIGYLHVKEGLFKKGNHPKNDFF